MLKIKHNIEENSALLFYVTLNYFIRKLKQLGFSFINRNNRERICVRGGGGGGMAVQGVGPVQAPMSSDNFDAVIDLRFLLGNARNACFSPTFRRQIEKWEPQEKTSNKLFWYASDMHMPLEMVHNWTFLSE